MRETVQGLPVWPKTNRPELGPAGVCDRHRCRAGAGQGLERLGCGQLPEIETRLTLIVTNFPGLNPWESVKSVSRQARFNAAIRSLSLGCRACTWAGRRHGCRGGE